MKMGDVLPSTEVNFPWKTPVTHRIGSQAALGGSLKTVKRTSPLSLHRTRFLGRSTNSLVNVLSCNGKGMINMRVI
jgi:hypothetical protein